MQTTNSYPSEYLLDQLANALVGPGYIVIDEPLPPALIRALVDDCNAQQAAFTPAGMGRQRDYQRDQRVRGDAIQWLEEGAPAVTEFLCWMDKLRLGINQRLFMGLFDYECHYAVYQPGAFYQKHRDAFRGKPGRKLSTVLYLNPQWDLVDGGELVLYDDAGESQLLSVAPECGRLVIFLSENFPHEVLPAKVPRRSIAGWFRIKSV